MFAVYLSKICYQFNEYVHKLMTDNCLEMIYCILNFTMIILKVSMIHLHGFHFNEFVMYTCSVVYGTAQRQCHTSCNQLTCMYELIEHAVFCMIWSISVLCASKVVSLSLSSTVYLYAYVHQNMFFM